ncbi:outer membrane beta-barrel family protein [Chryseobacterium suipulveris]|uniref:Outer membrane beta-barrel family protein n=1 Tax=Chryseobacterium suipulveris TaxID=2929800 RepID=A0ABY4BUH9_9FLAO|nr:outer membrane beta-barrel family protein [Chryseobacterium suipulveris]UOE41852.1 outer membrane beta-barrel family protein [Chryseobacterium suipulveris]
MKKFTVSVLLLSTTIVFAQETKTDSTKTKEIAEVTVIAKKPTVETKVDRTVFNVANSSILAGNTSWDVLRMTPLVAIDNNDTINAEGLIVTVYINDRKSVFTGKELKEYLKSIPAENLMKIEVITTPSSRYETSGAVINIVLKKPDNEGMKGSASFTNTQSTKNSQYTNLNLNYHKNKFTQTVSGSYGDNLSVVKSFTENYIYADQSSNRVNIQTDENFKTPSFSTSSEVELNDKNSAGMIFEFSQTNRTLEGKAVGEQFLNNILQNNYEQTQNLTGLNRSIGNNYFYKYYDKEKNKILDLNTGFNYFGLQDTNDRFRTQSNTENSGNRIIADNENREYYVKADYSQPLGKSGSQLELGGKMNFRNNVIPYTYLNFSGNGWVEDFSRSNHFQYKDNLNSVYANFTKTFFKKLETRIGLRYEHISFNIKQDIGNIGRSDSYGTFLPNLLLKYSFNDNYNLSATYNHNLWRPWFSEFNPFLMPTDDGNYFRGNMELLPNPSDRFTLKLGLYKKYFLTASYWFTNQDYWNSFSIENGKTINMPTNFSGRVERYGLFFNTNQMFLKNKLSINVNAGYSYTDNSDFNDRNNLGLKKYLNNFTGNSNISYTNLFNKNINLNAWIGVFTQNNGNTIANGMNVFHTVSATKIFPALEMEATVRLNNIFARPNFDGTTYSPIGTFRNEMKWDWYGVSFTLVKRFGNQKVKENTKTNVEKESGGGK